MKFVKYIESIYTSESSEYTSSIQSHLYRTSYLYFFWLVNFLGMALPGTNNEGNGTILTDYAHFHVISMRPTDADASLLNAEGEKSRSAVAQPTHLSVTLTVTLLPWSVKGRGSVDAERGRRGQTNRKP